MPLINVPTCWYHFMYGVSLTFVVMSKVLFMQNILSELIFSPNLNAPCKKKKADVLYDFQKSQTNICPFEKGTRFSPNAS